MDSSIQLKSGVYFNMPEEEYFALPAVHNSLLKTLKDQTPKHAIHQAFHDSPTTKSQKMGSVGHKGLLEPELFKREVVPYLSGDGRKKRVKQSKKLIKKLYPEGRYYIKLSEYQDVQKQVSEAVDNEIGKALFRNLRTEVTMIAEDPLTGLPLKCRWDAINFDMMVGFDYKTTRDANPDSFMWDIYKYGYYRQLAFYLYVAEILGYDMKKFLILAQEKKAPYVAVWYDIFAGAITKGRMEIQELLTQFAECLHTNTFDGYVNEATGRNLIEIDLPHKAYEFED